MNRAVKIRIYPNKEQRVQIEQTNYVFMIALVKKNSNAL